MAPLLIYHRGGSGVVPQERPLSRFNHSFKASIIVTSRDLIEPGDSVEETLHRLGYTTFRPQQQQAIEFLLAGNNVLAILPTGSGKSLIYQIAALHRPGISLVISPLIALMQDQVDTLQAQGIAATFINSSLSEAEEEARLLRMVDGSYKIVYVTPERLRQAKFQERLEGMTGGLLAVDEAHSIAQLPPRLPAYWQLPASGR